MPNLIEPNELYRDKRGEVFVLLERTGETMPSSGKWALARWRVAFPDRFRRYDTESQYFRWIEETDVTENNNIVEPIPGLDYFDRILQEEEEEKARRELEKAEEKAEKKRLAQEAKLIEGTNLNRSDFDKALEGLATEGMTVTTVAKHRGRPAVGMNELKAKNAIRDYKQRKREADDPLVTEAFDWLVAAGQDDYLEKHFV